MTDSMDRACDDTTPALVPTVRHCSDGERLSPGKWFCGPDCRDLEGSSEWEA